MKKVLGNISVIASTVIAGTVAVWCLIKLLMDIGPYLLSGLLEIVTFSTTLLITGLGISAVMFSRFIATHFDKLFE